MCAMPCPAGCLGMCDRVTGKCHRCVDGRYGQDNCTQYCDDNCKDVACDVTTGYCQCLNHTYYSIEKSMCEDCSEGCNSTCGETGNCLCKQGYFGVRCDNTCSETCKTNDCDVTNGMCGGCKQGFHGNFCEKKCPTGCSECHQQSGSCGGKCLEGYAGSNCEREYVFLLSNVLMLQFETE